MIGQSPAQQAKESCDIISGIFIPIEEVSAVLGMSKQALYRAVRNKQIPHQRIIPGGPIRFVRTDIENFLKMCNYAPKVSNSS